jgi:exopolyphosphatase / guanosine-5'-triphosphate,3'-diphosphate pyrophosphatase
VARLSLSLFDQLRPSHRLDAEARELLDCASLLHDIGWHIASRGHHHHSSYLILHGGLDRFFSVNDLSTIACIARYHRKVGPTTRHRLYTSLPAQARRRVDVGAALLRIADGLDRSHVGVVRQIKTRVDGDGGWVVRLTTRSDADAEIWAAKRKSDVFESVFRRPIDFEY